ncbi:hypothetical protein P280DRAFT_80713 [Massarina eburnea CBS 473.64]|uniref:Uncharacterized protein n=1 Tax=Massarina eburnea CBS 473.64 TaxID=1395130 RepID=A0A6A6RT52_9PLEO|nr:hypothetical protein P280DRAFT_80713 [Massarina eburnea CBS 473.64]
MPKELSNSTVMEPFRDWIKRNSPYKVIADEMKQSRMEEKMWEAYQDEVQTKEEEYEKSQKENYERAMAEYHKRMEEQYKKDMEDYEDLKKEEMMKAENAQKGDNDQKGSEKMDTT